MAISVADKLVLSNWVSSCPFARLLPELMTTYYMQMFDSLIVTPRTASSGSSDSRSTSRSNNTWMLITISESGYIN